MHNAIKIGLAALASATLACNAASLMLESPTEVLEVSTATAVVVPSPTVIQAIPAASPTALDAADVVSDDEIGLIQVDKEIVAAPMQVATISPQTAVPLGNVIQTAPEDNNAAAPPTEMQALAETVFGNDLPVRLEISTLDVATDVIAVGWRASSEGVQWDSPKNAAGFVINSAAPGQPGNTVIYGHNNIEGEVFKNLSDVETGDEITLTAEDGTVYRYEVEEVVRFKENGITDAERLAHLSYFDPTEDQRLTLLTCWPYTGNSHRVAVVAKPTS